MKKAAKILELILAAVLLLSSFAGCTAKDAGKDSTSATTATVATTAAPSTAAVEEKIHTIKWVGQGDHEVDNDSPIVKEMEKRLNVDFDFVFINRSQMYEILNMRIASNDIPDVFGVNETNYRNYIKQGVLSDIPEETIKKVAPTLYELELKNGSDLAWNYAKEDGKIYGVPVLNWVSDYHYIPLWRSDWMKNVGIEKIPETLAEAEELFKRFVNDDPDKNGKNDTYALSDKGMSAIFGAFGGIPFQSKGGNGSYTWSVGTDGKVIATPVMPEMKEALTLLNKWYNDGWIDPEFITEENKGQYWAYSVPFWNGKIGFTVPGLYYHVNPPLKEGEKPGAFYDNFKKLQPEGTYIEGKPLTGAGGKAGLEKWNRLAGAYSVMSRNVKKEPGKMEKILEVSERLVSDFDFREFVQYGVKGTHFDIVDGAYTALAPYDKAEIKGKLGIGAQSIGLLNATNYDFVKRTARQDQIAYADKNSKYTTNYENVVWIGLPSDSQYKAIVEKKMREGFVLFITGERKLDEFDKFVEECNKAGLEQLTKEANEWYLKNTK